MIVYTGAAMEFYIGEPTSKYDHEVEIEVDVGRASFISFEENTFHLNILEGFTTHKMVGDYDIEIHLYDPIYETSSTTSIRLILLARNELNDLALDEEFVDEEGQVNQVIDEVGVITESTVLELIASLDQLKSAGLAIDGEFDLMSNIFGSSV